MKKMLLATLLIFSIAIADAATITAVSSGPWLSTSTWSCGCLPSGSDNVIIPPGINVTVNIPGVILSNLFQVITVTVSGVLTINSTFLAVDGNDIVRINNGGSIVATGVGGSVFSGLVNFALSSGASMNGPGTITNGTLPVTLLFFKGVKENQSAVLSWATASEKNSDVYRIERSVDGTGFEEIAVVKSAGNSTALLNYSYTDEYAFEGRMYYRLKAVDEDGTSVTFKTIAVGSGGEKKVVDVYPNPITNNTIRFDVNFTPGLSDIVLVHKSDGTSHEKFTFKEGRNEIILPPNAAPGCYIFQLISDGKSFFSRIISQ